MGTPATTIKTGLVTPATIKTTTRDLMESLSEKENMINLLKQQLDLIEVDKDDLTKQVEELILKVEEGRLKNEDLQLRVEEEKVTRKKAVESKGLNEETVKSLRSSINEMQNDVIELNLSKT